MVEYREPSTSNELDYTRTLFREYAAYLDLDLSFQDFEGELTGLPGAYSRPGGLLLLAYDGDRPVGSVGVRPMAPRVCELKRMYVRPTHRGRGVGRELAGRALAFAAGAGYSIMRLDTLTRLDQAAALYRSLGFVEIPPYYDNPIPDALYMERRLATRGGVTVG